jgi:hypothetical protein
MSHRSDVPWPATATTDVIEGDLTEMEATP